MVSNYWSISTKKRVHRNLISKGKWTQYYSGPCYDPNVPKEVVENIRWETGVALVTFEELQRAL